MIRGGRSDGTLASWARRCGAALLVLGAVVGVASCNGKSQEEAEAWCSQLRDNDPFGSECITDDAYDECVTCFMNCGKCRELKTCPQTFECY